MKKSLYLIMLCVIFASHAQPPEIEWSRTYGGLDNEFLNSVDQTNDGGYIMTGWTWSYGEGENDIYVIKTDESGDSLWSHTFGGVEKEYSWSVRATSDGGVIVGSETNTFSEAYYDAYNAKIDADGDTVWTQLYGGLGSDWCGSIEEVPGDGFIFTGSTSSMGAGVADIWLVKTDSDGETEWIRPCGGPDYDYGYSVCVVEDGGYAACGATLSFGEGDRDVYLVRVDEQGDTLWTRTYGTENTENGLSIKNTQDGGFIIAGFFKELVSEDNSVLVIKTDSEGEVEWFNIYGGGSNDKGNDVVQTTDGDFLVVGSTASFGAGETDAYILKLNAEGDTLWTTTVGSESRENGQEIRLTSDGGFFIGGQVFSMESMSQDYWLVKFAPDHQPLMLEVTPIGLPIYIPPGGGTFGFDATVTNLTNETLFFDAWTEVVTPGGDRFGPLILVEDIPLAAFGAIEGSPVQYVPEQAPPAIYTYVTWIGDYAAGIAYDTESFEIEKFGGALIENTGGIGLDDWTMTGFFDNPELSRKFQDAMATTKNENPLITSDIFPNPFNSTTNLNFELLEDSAVEITLFNINGQLISKIKKDVFPKGYHEIIIQPDNLSNGIYFININIPGQITQIKKLLYVK